jgi:uncharacterized membrane protein
MRELNLLDLPTLLCALGSGLIAGFFFAFSVCVMKALGNLPAPRGIAAMQTINVVVINPVFLSAFLGTAAACVWVSIGALVRWQGPTSSSVLAGSVLYLIGGVLVTMRCNVPRNDALAAVTPDSVEAARLWLDYLSSWTAWNHVRALASLAAAALFSIALWLRG